MTEFAYVTDKMIVNAVVEGYDLICPVCLFNNNNALAADLLAGATGDIETVTCAYCDERFKPEPTRAAVEACQRMKSVHQLAKIVLVVVGLDRNGPKASKEEQLQLYLEYYHERNYFIFISLDELFAWVRKNKKRLSTCVTAWVSTQPT